MVNELKKENFPKLASLMQGFVQRLATDWPKILGQGANLVFDKFTCNEFGSFKPRIDDRMALLEYELSGQYQGKIFIMFPQRDAIIIGGSLLMEDEGDIKMIISSCDLNADYLDAFSEFGNQTAASFETVYRISFPENEGNYVRFKGSHLSPFVAGKIKEVFCLENDNELFIVETHCSIWSFDKGDISFIVSNELAESFYNETVSASTVKIIGNMIVADKSKKSIAFLKKALRNSGYNVFICNDANTAISKLQQARFIDLVLIDANLGDYYDDGLALCLRIKRNMLLDNIPIIMCAENATKKIVLEAIRVGACDFLIKPYTKEKLLEKLRKHLKKEHVH